MRSLHLLLGTSLALVACGGNDAAPALITGGGVGSGEIDGRVNVYVIDSNTFAAISGAKVRVGSISGMTDANGLFTAKGDLSGKQDVAVVADMHVPTLWAGVNGANVTIPVRLTTQATVAQAELDGTIDNWATLPAPAQGHATLATITYTWTTRLDDPANSIGSPSGTGGIPANLCLNSQFGNPGCDFKVNARTGSVALFATITDRDFKGTPTNFADDTAVVSGFAWKGGLAVNGGVNQTGVTLTSLAAGDTQNATVAFGTVPAALTTVGGLVYVDLGADGMAPILRDPLAPLTTISPTNTSVLVPKLSAFTGASYRIVASAQGNTGQSIINKHGLTDVSNVSLGDWLGTPTGMMFASDTVSATAVSGASLLGFEISNASSTSWSVSIFDGSTSAKIPTDLAPIPTGSNTLKAQAIDVSADLKDFNLEHALDIVNRVSSDTTTFTK
ncbi:MAG TPA: hypothetical protein VL463_24215 [Kofleriaceae bacterium]|nr:hypothetical protein [Kofleriaceae bacterium]